MKSNMVPILNKGKAKHPLDFSFINLISIACSTSEVSKEMNIQMMEMEDKWHKNKHFL